MKTARQIFFNLLAIAAAEAVVRRVERRICRPKSELV
jgi:hypothetical protein